jgi:diguanylate cyclase (GGDEF)-like protein
MATPPLRIGHRSLRPGAIIDTPEIMSDRGEPAPAKASSKEPSAEAPAQNFSRDQVEPILGALDRAIEEHVAWLQGWNRAALCRLAPPRDVISEQAHFLCAFGSWYDAHRGEGLLDQPAFRALEDAHREMHDLARELAGVVAKAGRLDPQRYDGLVQRVNAFNAQARRLERAFRAALSDLDPLTGVPSRQTMMREIERERERAARTGQPCCVAIADLDHFKRINDTYGHPGGDQVLLATAGTFMAGLRPYDMVFRYGGEEFLLCLPNSDRDSACQVIERLRERVAEAPVRLDDGRAVPVTASFGVAELVAGLGIAQAIERADQALYAAKSAGRNCVRCWKPGGRFD